MEETMPAPKLQSRCSREEGVIKILIASPSDTGDARSSLIERLERNFRENGYDETCGHRIVTECWEDLASQPGYGQDIINSQILPEVDIILALFKWTLGTPVINTETREERALSGTVEELLYAICNPEVEIPPIGMLYFFEDPPMLSKDSPESDIIHRKWDALQEFQKNIQDKVLHKTYKEPDDLLQIAASDLAKNIKTYFKHGNSLNHQEHKLKFEAEDKREIMMYWGYRPLAHNDIREAISASAKEIFISGIALTSISPALNDPWVIKKIAANINSNPELSITILKLASYEHSRTKEKGGELLEHKMEISRRELIEFEQKLDSLVDEGIHRPIVKFLTYDEGIYPHHFIMRVDDYIYVGSYLSHQSGSHSYLIKLRDYDDLLFALFEQEIEFLKENSSPFDIKNSE
jgi:hypothetical protein